MLRGGNSPAIVSLFITVYNCNTVSLYNYNEEWLHL